MPDGVVLVCAEDVVWDADFIDFDEAGCHVYLCRVGERAVARYPFSLGMEEVYGCLYLRYGDDGISDAISLLHEILEDKSSAGAGFGLADDIFRVWKDPWRHRDDNQLDPFVPHCGWLVLPPATPVHIRRLRAQNFLNNNPAAAFSVRVSAEEDPIPSLVHQRYRTLESQQAATCAATRRAELGRGEVRSISSIISHRATLSLSASLDNIDPHFALLETPRRDPTASQLWTVSTGAASALQPFITAEQTSEPFLLSPTRYIAGSTRAEAFDVKEPDPTESDPLTSIPLGGLEILRQNHFRNRSLSRNRRLATKPTTDAIIEPDKTEEDGTLESEQQKIQRSHRSARLLNGEIRTPIEVRDHFIHELHGDDAFVAGGVNAEPLSTSFQDSFTHTESSNGFNKKGQGRKTQVRKWFRFGHKQNQTPSIKNRKSGIKHLFSGCGLPSFPRRPPTLTRQATRERPMHGWITYDGACSPKSSISSAHLNKPLPLSPGDRARAKYLRHTQSTSPSHVSSNSTAPPTASIASTDVSKIFSKREFREITRDLLRQESMENSPTLSPPRKGKRIAGINVEPKKHIQIPPPPLTFTSIEQRNPFTDAPVSVSPTATTPRAPRREPIEDIVPMPSLSLSRSEPSFSDYSPQVPPRSYYDAAPVPNQPSTTPPSQNHEIEESRGRKARPQTPPPDIEYSPRGGSNSSKPPKRSRSPVKRLLGIVKNTPDEVTKHSEKYLARDPTPISSTKRSLKEWGSKLKNGFLTADNGEQDREACIEEYNSSNVVKKVLPPATFPISLDPSYQARLVADLELMLVVTSNRFLLREAGEGRISPASISKTRHAWEDRNLAQVVEFQFDQATQRGLILSNLGSVEFCGQIATDTVALTAALHAWGIMANEMSVRTFCAGDSVIRKWLNDIPRIFEMLDAPYITFQTFEKIQTKTQLVIGQRQRLAREAGALEETQSFRQQSASPSRQVSNTRYVFRGASHNRSTSNDSYIQGLYGGMDAQVQALGDSLENRTCGTSNVERHQSPESWRIISPAPSFGSLAHQVSHFPRNAYESARGGRLGIMRDVSAGYLGEPRSLQARDYRAM